MMRQTRPSRLTSTNVTTPSCKLTVINKHLTKVSSLLSSAVMYSPMPCPSSLRMNATMSLINSSRSKIDWHRSARMLSVGLLLE